MSDTKHLPKKISRRDFLKVAGTGAVSLSTAACRTGQDTAQPQALDSGVSSQDIFEHTAAIVRADSYEPGLVRSRVAELVESLGGFGDLIKPGASVAIKVNLVGGSYYEPHPGVNPIDSYVTHPEVTRAVGELLLEAGAGQLYIVEAIYDQDSFSRWGYTDVADSLGATLVDLNNSSPYREFTSCSVGDGWFIYDHFKLNPLLSEVDAFISVSKMKCHFSVGVTHAMKNLVGLTPIQHYRTSPEHFWRSSLHGDDYGPERLPRAIVDLNRARPIHFALIDGIKTAEGGEVPRGSFKPVEPGLLIAGANPVATDAVATAAMGFDPAAEFPAPPFLHGENYLNLARTAGLGTNDLSKIEVLGASIEAARFNFAPSTKQSYNDSHTPQVM